MSRRLAMEHERLRRRLEHGDPLWPAQLAVATAILLNLGLSDRVTIGPVWLLPAIEGVLLAALVAIAPRRVSGEGAGPRHFALAVIGFVSVANIVSLALLVRFLVIGGHAQGRALIGSGALLWLTNVLLFAVWFWEMDRGGPVARHRGEHAMTDFQFPQMENPQLAPPGWRPGFGDYLYTSLTNATAFSPTDTMPLTVSAKLVMGLQSVAALATVGLVVARAVNILG
ncbi:MAG TPA: hypothetical protein VFT42_09530 [Solirubrobacteraceae bacterium]|nr:hypothetical protein [Solirubrobacteraceae bacterium]